jgi:hypothetical protein
VGSATNYVGAAAEVGEGPGTGSTGCDFTVTGTSGGMVNKMGSGLFCSPNNTLTFPMIATP